MEDLLTQLIRDASSPKFAAIRKSCQAALDLLENRGQMEVTPAHVLRQRCLEPLQLALESKTKKLATFAVGGIQVILKDERFQSSMECESEEKWLPIQVLNTVITTPCLPEDTQVDIMKLLLNMTFSTAWCMNAKVITRVSQVYVDTYMASTHNVKGAVKAALTQLLSSFTEKLQNAETMVEDDAGDVLADFKARGNANVDSIMTDVVTLLQFFTDKLEYSTSQGHNKLSIPLLLEGIYSIVSHTPTNIQDNGMFQEILWKHLCPTLISLLGTPKSERSVPVQKPAPNEELGRGSGCSLSAPNLHTSTAKTIYSIAISLVELMGPIGSLRPVLESLFHRMLLYPPPQHRLDALKAVKELLKVPENLYNIAAPTLDGDVGEVPRVMSNKNLNADISLLKLIMDSVQECCHCNDMSVCVTSIGCVDELLGSLEHISRGLGMTETLCDSIEKHYKLLKESGPQTSLPHDGGSWDATSIALSDESLLDPGGGSLDILVSDDNSCNDSFEIVSNQTSGDQEEKVRILETPVQQQNLQHQRLIMEEMERRYKRMGIQYEAVERQNAGELIVELHKILPHLGNMMTQVEVDEALKQFSANFCLALYEKQSQTSEEDTCHMAILNADGVYVATVMALLFSLKLSTSGWYNRSSEMEPVLSEKDFVDSILGCGLLLFLSPAWLNEVYHQVCNNNLAQEFTAGYHSQLTNLLLDLDGLGSHDQGGQLLTSAQSYDMSFSSERITAQKFAETGKKFSRRVLSRCWESVLDVLSVLLNGKSSCGISSSLALMLGTEGAKEESLRARDGICTSLNGLQKAARLCCTLGLQERCGSVFSQLATTSCVMLDHQKSPMPERKAKPKHLQHNKPKPVRLHASHILSMDVVMTTGLEMGSHSADCWKHVFRCSAFISELEHNHFSRGNNQSSLPRVQTEQTIETQDREETELYSVPVSSVVPVAPRINLSELIKQSGLESGWERSLTGGGVLNSVQASQAVCGLSQEVDRLFEDAAETLNLNALLNFLLELCEASQQQLLKMTKSAGQVDHHSEHQLPPNALHLYRLQEVLMKIVHSDRPLVHLIRSWSVVSTYLVEAAGHRERSVSKMAVTCVHDFILAILCNHPELPCFQVNELLCKTFENMLCLDLCDGDVQDQIVCSICELVEACTANIRSGWRPLFGALRAVKIEYTTNEEVNEARQRHIAAVLDVFEVYLNTDNVLVFANATVDCILCLLKYVRGPGGFDDSSDDDSDSGSDFVMTSSDEKNLCIPALDYLQQCSKILQTMWKMPACPVFNGAHRIHVDMAHQLVDSKLHHMNMGDFTRHYTEADLQSCRNISPQEAYDPVIPESLDIPKGPTDNSQSDLDTERDPLCSQEDEKRYDSSSLTSVDSGITIPVPDKTPASKKTEKNSRKSHDSTSGANNEKTQYLNETDQSNSVSLLLLKNRPKQLSNQESMISVMGTLDSMDNHTGILHVWYMLLDGLAGCVSSCPKIYQPETMEILYKILRSTAQVPGPKFALYCVNGLLLPMIQNWLREGVRRHGYWETGATNFKQCCGLCTDLIVDFVHMFSEFPGDITMYVKLMVKQLFDILIECVSQPVEVISRLGCSCIRHMLLSAGSSFTEELWQISICAIQSALDVTTFYLRQLMLMFHYNSDNYCGDVAQVKVAMRRDSTPTGSERLRQLSHQVFLLDSQISSCSSVMSDSEEDKSFVFLLYRPGEDSLNPEDVVLRIPFRFIVVGLLSHQLLLQTIGSVLLCTDNLSVTRSGEKNPTQIQGMLPKLSTRNVLKFLQCLRHSYKLAGEFDSRPGLKFLIQKVARTEVAVNLYKQAGASMVFYIHTLLQICAHLPDINKDSVKLLSTCDAQGPQDVSQLSTEHTENIAKINSSPKLFLQLLRNICDELCQTYVNIMSDEGTSRADQMAEQQVFFLIAQPEDAVDIIGRKYKDQMGKSDQSDTIPSISQSDSVLPTTAEPLQEQEVDRSDDDESSDEEQSLCPEADKTVNPTKSKRELREEHDSKVYTIATDTLMKSLMSEYKKSKQRHAMPSFVKINKQKKKSVKMEMDQGTDQVIVKQRKASIMKDSEARIMSWTELLCTILELFHQLPDTKYHTLLPTVFNCVNQLVCHAQDQRLRDALGQWLHRVGTMLEFVDSHSN